MNAQWDDWVESRFEEALGVREEVGLDCPDPQNPCRWLVHPTQGRSRKNFCSFHWEEVNDE